MPKLGMEPIRRAALVKATIDEIGATGTLDITVSRIAERAGMSSALAHHYFGGKEQIFLAAMRHALVIYRQEVLEALARADGPMARLNAIIAASFASSNFHPEIIAAWLNFYVLAQSNPEAQRFLTLYQRRLHSNLVFNLRPLIGDRADSAAQRIAALIDGMYLRQGLQKRPDAGVAATAQVRALLEFECKAGQQ